MKLRDMLDTIKRNLAALWPHLVRAFDRTATWVAQLSWWKFFLFAILMLIAGSIIEKTLFSSSKQVVMVSNKDHHSRRVTTDDADIRIDNSGIHIRKGSKPDTVQQPDDKDEPDAGPDGQTPPQQAQQSPVPPTPPTPPKPSHIKGELNIELPPEVSQEVRDAIEEALQEAADKKTVVYKDKAHAWFMNFVFLLVVFLFGTKALMGGKKRAEVRAAAAAADAEREALRRQVVEAKMQMMQAQVEPHFLFNTLASVEHLIETDPPRASRMQRTLIQYLRAVLPQMRDTPTTTSLGREADIARSYLDLLKMRMEERLTVDINVPEGLRSASFPPMMLVSLVENAIKHGLEGKPEGGTLRVMAEVFNSKLRVTVADNGLGFGAVPSDGTGLGLQNIRERLKLLYGEQAQLIIAPNSPSGVCATIEVPYHLANAH